MAVNLASIRMTASRRSVDRLTAAYPHLATPDGRQLVFEGEAYSMQAFLDVANPLYREASKPRIPRDLDRRPWVTHSLYVEHGSDASWLPLLHVLAHHGIGIEATLIDGTTGQAVAWVSAAGGHRLRCHTLRLLPVEDADGIWADAMLVQRCWRLIAKRLQIADFSGPNGPKTHSVVDARVAQHLGLVLQPGYEHRQHPQCTRRPAPRMRDVVCP